MPSPASMHELDDSTVHYEWNNGIAPRLEIEPGDTVAFRTRDAAEERRQYGHQAAHEGLDALPARMGGRRPLQRRRRARRAGGRRGLRHRRRNAGAGDAAVRAPARTPPARAPAAHHTPAGHGH